MVFGGLPNQIRPACSRAAKASTESESSLVYYECSTVPEGGTATQFQSRDRGSSTVNVHYWSQTLQMLGMRRDSGDLCLEN
jgi:hypothetical protein